MLGNAWDAKAITKYNTKTWIEVNDQSGGPYNTNKQIKFQAYMSRSDLCDFSNAYIVVKGVITVYARRGPNRNIDTLEN